MARRLEEARWLSVWCTLLCALVRVVPTPGTHNSPLPEWQQEILAGAKKGSRVSVHRSAYPEDEALRAAGKAIALAPSLGVEVIVGMTTTPKRIEFIEPTIRSMLNQTQPATIVLNVPSRYNSRRNHWNGASISLPGWLERLAATRTPCAPCVVVHTVDEDWGPATKLVGTAVALRKGLLSGVPVEDAVVVAADDDHEWEPFALATLIARGFENRTKRPEVWTYYSYAYPRSRLSPGPRVCVAQAGDLLAAPARLLAPLPVWGRELLPGGRLPSCLFVDDLFFAAFFATQHRALVFTHPWRFWLFRQVKKRQKQQQQQHHDGQLVTPCRGACSPVLIRFRYPDSLAMGKPRDTHNTNCHAQLQALGWWPDVDYYHHPEKEQDNGPPPGGGEFFQKRRTDTSSDPCRSG